MISFRVENMKQLDLHMHSNYSADGEHPPAELVRLCHGRGIGVMALTDHNSIKGILEATEAAKGYGIHVISGIELDCTFNEVNLHILGYGIHEDQCYHDYEKEIEEQEIYAGTRRMELIEKLGIFFSRDRVREISNYGIITGEAIAEAAMEEKTNRSHPLMEAYFPSGDRSDNPLVNFYWDLCAKGKPAHVPINYMTLSEAVSLIHDTGGVPVFAHPHQNIGKDEDLLHGIISQGVLGIEAMSSYHDGPTISFYLKKAREMGLFYTAGSDFHGRTKPSISLGVKEAKGKEEEILRALSQHLL